MTASLPDLAGLERRVELAKDEVVRLCQPSEHWRMPVPVDEARDSGWDEAREAVARWLAEGYSGAEYAEDHGTNDHWTGLADELLALPELGALLRDGEQR